MTVSLRVVLNYFNRLGAVVPIVDRTGDDDASDATLSSNMKPTLPVFSRWPVSGQL